MNADFHDDEELNALVLGSLSTLAFVLVLLAGVVFGLWVAA